MFAALLDTNVLVPNYLRDVLLEVAERGVYQVLWSDEILAELEDTLLELFEEDGRDSAESQAAVHRLRIQLATAFPDALVTGWAALESTYQLPDPDDRHVVAAAVKGRADVIVTNNVKDFPTDKLPAGLDVQSADEFLLRAIGIRPDVVLAAIAQVASRTGRTGPKLTADQVIDALQRCNAVQSTQELRNHRTARAYLRPEPQ